MQAEWQAVQRLLVVRLDNLGDVLLTGAAVASLARALPGASITALCGPAGAPAAELLPGIDNVLVHEAPWVDPWKRIPHDPNRDVPVIDRLRNGPFDAAVIFTSYRQSCLPAAYLCYLADIPRRLGYSFEASGSLLTTRVNVEPHELHEVERNLALVGAVGVPGVCRELSVDIPDFARAAVGRWLQAIYGQSSRRPLIVVHPGCSMPARTYSQLRYAEVVELLVRTLGANVVITGTEPEREIAQEICGRLTRAVRRSVQIRAGSWPLSHLAALIDAADLVITNNTGPMHLAAAVGTPSVVLFALTNPPDQWRPWNAPHRLLYQDVPCRLCYSRVCPRDDHRCLNGVPPSLVVASAHELLNEQAAA